MGGLSAMFKAPTIACLQPDHNTVTCNEGIGTIHYDDNRFMKSAPSTSVAVVIREAREDELAAAVRFWEIMREELGARPGEGLAADWLERGAAYYEKRHRRGELRSFFAEHNGATVGTATGFLLDGFPAYLVQRPHVGFIVGVYVVPEYRRCGIGRAVTQAAIDWLRSIGCTSIRLRTSAQGRPVYASMGFAASPELELRFGDLTGECPLPD